MKQYAQAYNSDLFKDCKKVLLQLLTNISDEDVDLAERIAVDKLLAGQIHAFREVYNNYILVANKAGRFQEIVEKAESALRSMTLEALVPSMVTRSVMTGMPVTRTMLEGMKSTA